MSVQHSHPVLPCYMEGKREGEVTNCMPSVTCLPPNSTYDNGFFYLKLPAAVCSVLVISDMHLSWEQPENFQAWQRFMRQATTDILLLGDVFDVWVGDDILDASAVAGKQASPSLHVANNGYHSGYGSKPSSLSQRHRFAWQCVQVLRECVQAGRRVYIMRGNRDFLLGERFFAETGCYFLPDPCVLQWDSAFGSGSVADGYLLSHGDVLCSDDRDYLVFRQQVRSAKWQQNFLTIPLPERVQVAEQLREQSENHQSTLGAYVDVNTAAARSWLQRAKQSVLVHGHTHKPAYHDLSDKNRSGQEVLRRYVLSDWQLTASPPRGDALLLHADGSIQRIHTTNAGVGSGSPIGRKIG